MDHQFTATKKGNPTVVIGAHFAKKGRVKYMTLSLRSESNASDPVVRYSYAI